MTNTIVYFNTNVYVSAASDVYTTVPARFGYSCAPELTNAGAFNIVDNPLFTDVNTGRYTLQPLSPCVGKGLDQAWMKTAVDLAGNKRIAAGDVDMGAYEVMPPDATLLILR